jgi:thioredoxin
MTTLIDFYADWCGPCQFIKPIIKKLQVEFEGKLQVEEVNVDTNQKRASEFGVVSIPTLVIAKEGKEIDRKIGAVDEVTLRSWIQNHI